MNDRMRAALEQAATEAKEVCSTIHRSIDVTAFVEEIVTSKGRSGRGVLWRALELATEERTCATCEHCTSDTYDSLPMHQRSGTCSRVGDVFDFEVNCTAYCYGGSTVTGEIELESLDFGCIHHTPKQSPTPPTDNRDDAGGEQRE